jgi:anti-sigma regulatory factor (Ser/Thr protein kinase)
VPYFLCNACRLTVYAGSGHSGGRACPNCGDDLAGASRAFVRPDVSRDVRRHMVREPQAAAAARRELEGLADDLDARERRVAALLMTELIANSVQHAGSGGGSLIALDMSVTSERVRVAVRDGGIGFVPDERPADPMAGSWGLQLVDSLADRWCVSTDRGTVVTFELDRASAV